MEKTLHLDPGQTADQQWDVVLGGIVLGQSETKIGIHAIDDFKAAFARLQVRASIAERLRIQGHGGAQDDMVDMPKPFRATAACSVGRLKTIKAPDNTVTTNAYDVAGQLTTVTDALGRVTTMAYNNRGWQTKLTDALGQVTTTSYDVEGNTTAIQDANGNRTTYTFDALNRVTVVQDAVSNRTTTTFDAARNVLSVKNPRGFTTSYAYDALNRQTRVIEAFGQVEQRTTTTVYDAVSNVLSVTNPRGFTTVFAACSVSVRLLASCSSEIRCSPRSPRSSSMRFRRLWTTWAWSSISACWPRRSSGAS